MGLKVAGKKAKTESEVIEIEPFQAVHLLMILNAIMGANRAAMGTVATWIAKNVKKLRKLHDKSQLIDREIEDRFTTKNDKGWTRAWDNKEDGQKAWLMLNEETGRRMVVDDEGKRITEGGPFFPFVEADKRDEYLKEKEAFNKRTFPVSVVKIDAELLEQVVVPLSSEVAPGQRQPHDLELFHECLTISEDESTDEANSE